MHAPYLGGATPFRIGLAPIEAADWLEIDALRDAELAEKRRLLAADPDAAFAAEPGARAAQEEVAARVGAFLSARGLGLAPAPADAPPLLRAGLSVQEDLLVMARDGETGAWRLTAGALFFPSGWRLREKFGLPLDAIHAPVPGFRAGDRNAAVIARIFDGLAADAPVARFNWSIYPDGGLSRPDPRRLDADALDAAHVRVERQTLLKTPETGAILFTVRIHLTPLRALAGERAAALADAVAALSPDERAYKGASAAAPALLAYLRAKARS